jgi:hypothetical protein
MPYSHIENMLLNEKIKYILSLIFFFHIIKFRKNHLNIFLSYWRGMFLMLKIYNFFRNGMLFCYTVNFKKRTVSLEITFNNQFEGNDEMH